MKVGTDAVLLGAWAFTEGDCKRVLDIGTGSGIIALMLAQRFQWARIDAIEIDSAAGLQAKQNFSESNWGNRLNCETIDFNAFIEDRKSNQAANNTFGYDLIVSNPPYFNQSLQAPDEKRNWARHGVQLTFEQLLAGTGKLLNEKGFFCVILPISAAESFINLALLNNLFLYKKTIVYPKPNRNANRVLMAFSKQNFGGNAIQADLQIENEARFDYTEGYKQLTKDFYLKF